MLDGWHRAAVRAQPHPDLSPLAWHVGHVFFVETWWLQARVFGDNRATAAWQSLYWPGQCAKDSRAARLPAPDNLREWTLAREAENDRYWQQAEKTAHPLLANGYLAAFIRQHYAQHLETMHVAARQLKLARAAWPARPAPLAAQPASVESVSISGGRSRIGTPTTDAYDNEQPVIDRHVETFAIARQPVTNGQWLGFMQAGGYAVPELWDADGWRWRRRNGITHPQHWRAHPDGAWCCPGEALTTDAPVHGVGWYEARAYARYAGARLPHEAEWERAARKGAIAGCGQVWEWCDNALYPYPGFAAFPYDGYSLPWFDGAHFVARGASIYTQPDVRRPGFRNFYPPTHRHVFAGLRLAW